MGVYTIPDRDSDNRQVNRVAAATKGWTYLAHPFELETSVLSSSVNNDWQGNDRGDVTFKLYDAQDNEITTQASADLNCVKTVLIFKPSYDYELIGGSIHQVIAPSNDVRLWTIGGPLELGANYVKEMVGGLNMKYMGSEEQIETDGRASKYMRHTTEGVPYQTNQLQFIIKHPAGTKHKLMILLEYFRA